MVAATAITGLDVLRAASEGLVETPPAAALLGWKALSLEPGRVRVRYTARPEFANPQGAVQGGFLAAMLDDAMGPALFTTLGAKDFAPTIEMKVSYLRPGPPRPPDRRGAGRPSDALTRLPRGHPRNRGRRSRGDRHGNGAHHPFNALE